MPPGAVGIRTLPLLSVVLQVAGNLGGGVAGEPLAHEGRHAGHVGGRLAGATETRVVLVQGAQRRCSAVRPDDVGLEPPVRGWAAAAVRIDGANVVPVGRAYRQHAEVGAFRRIADAAVLGVVLNASRTPNSYLNPVGRLATVVGYPYAEVPRFNCEPEPNPFEWHMTAFSRLRSIAREKDFASSSIGQMKVQIRARSIPIVFPTQLYAIKPTRSNEYTHNFVILAAEPQRSIAVGVRVASKPGIISIIARRVDPSDIAGLGPIHRVQSTGADWRSAIAGTVEKPGHRVVDNRYPLGGHPRSGGLQVSR